MNVYTDPSLLDVAGAMEVLPQLSLSKGARAYAQGAVEQYSIYSMPRRPARGALSLCWLTCAAGRVQFGGTDELRGSSW
jgi:hypothetical protein